MQVREASVVTGNSESDRRQPVRRSKRGTGARVRSVNPFATNARLESRLELAEIMPESSDVPPRSRPKRLRKATCPIRNLVKMVLQ
jgi:hypothetical protein